MEGWAEGGVTVRELCQSKGGQVEGCARDGDGVSQSASARGRR